MRSLLLLISLLSFSAQAAKLKCHIDPETLPGTMHGGFILVDMLNGECKSARGESFYIYMRSVGLTAHEAHSSSFVVSCPSIPENKLEGTYYGLKIIDWADFKTLKGMSVFGGKNGFCGVGFTERGRGLGITAGWVEISPDPVAKYYLREAH